MSVVLNAGFVVPAEEVVAGFRFIRKRSGFAVVDGKGFGLAVGVKRDGENAFLVSGVKRNVVGNRFAGVSLRASLVGVPAGKAITFFFRCGRKRVMLDFGNRERLSIRPLFRRAGRSDLAAETDVGNVYITYIRNGCAGYH